MQHHLSRELLKVYWGDSLPSLRRGEIMWSSLSIFFWLLDSEAWNYLWSGIVWQNKMFILGITVVSEEKRNLSDGALV